jgi:hypothetical protein
VQRVVELSRGGGVFRYGDYIFGEIGKSWIFNSVFMVAGKNNI